MVKLRCPRRFAPKTGRFSPELVAGFTRIRTEWLNTLTEDYKDRILPVDLTVSENWGEMQGSAEKNGLSFPTIDGLIAAIARTHNLVLVTRNESYFQGCNIPLFNPWKVDKNDKK